MRAKTLRWLSTAYFAKGILQVFLFTVSLLMLRQMGMTNEAITLSVSLCFIPWATKFVWKPVFSRPKYCWQLVLLTELLLVLAFSYLAFTLSDTVRAVGMLVVIAMLTAIHNVAVDTLCKDVLPEEALADYRTVRELSRKVSEVIGLGVIVMIVGNLQVVYRNAQLYSWRSVVFCMALFFLLLFFWHLLVLPRRRNNEQFVEQVGGRLARNEYLFLLLFLFFPTMQRKMAVLFLIASQSSGGLGLSPQELGFVLGTVGVIGGALGVVAGRKLVGSYGLQAMLLPLSVTVLVPSMVYAFLGYAQPGSPLVVWGGVFVEQMAYGLGLSLYLSALPKMLNTNLAKSLMALSMMVACMLAGYVQTSMGYYHFFLLTLCGTILSIMSARQLAK